MRVQIITLLNLVALECILIQPGISSELKARKRRQTRRGSCSTETRLIGSCTSIQRCPALNSLLQQVKQRTAPPNALAQLRRETLKCPFIGGRPQVCCAAASAGGASTDLGGGTFSTGGGGTNFGRRTPTTPAPFTRGTTRRVSRPQAPRPPSSSPGGITFVDSTPSVVNQSPTRPISPPRRPVTNPERRPAEAFPSLSSTSGQTMALPSEEECGRRTFDARIFGGRDADIGSWPWAVSVGYRVPGQQGIIWACGGALITSRHVLTAAHCIQGLSSGQTPEMVRLGELDFNRNPDCLREDPSTCAPTPIDAPIIGLIAHPEFRGRRNNAFAHDIGLLTLGVSVTTTDFVRPICLPLQLSHLSGGTDYADGKPAFIAGWGISEKFSSFTPALQEARILLRAPSVCEAVYRRDLTAGLGRRLCAGTGAGVDTCKGDSGGPLMVPSPTGSNWYLTGITSVGSSSCGTNPAIYTRVHQYIDWIQANLNVAI